MMLDLEKNIQIKKDLAKITEHLKLWLELRQIHTQHNKDGSYCIEKRKKSADDLLFQQDGTFIVDNISRALSSDPIKPNSYEYLDRKDQKKFNRYISFNQNTVPYLRDYLSETLDQILSVENLPKAYNTLLLKIESITQAIWEKFLPHLSSDDFLPYFSTDDKNLKLTLDNLCNKHLFSGIVGLVLEIANSKRGVLNRSAYLTPYLTVKLTGRKKQYLDSKDDDNQIKTWVNDYYFNRWKHTWEKSIAIIIERKINGFLKSRHLEMTATQLERFLEVFTRYLEERTAEINKENCAKITRTLLDQESKTIEEILEEWERESQRLKKQGTKIVIVGHQGTGKTNLALALTQNTFNTFIEYCSPTIGTSILPFGSKAKIQDISGSLSSFQWVPNYVKRSNIILLTISQKNGSEEKKSIDYVNTLLKNDHFQENLVAASEIIVVQTKTDTQPNSKNSSENSKEFEKFITRLQEKAPGRKLSICTVSSKTRKGINVLRNKLLESTQVAQLKKRLNAFKEFVDEALEAVNTLKRQNTENPGPSSPKSIILNKLARNINDISKSIEDSIQSTDKNPYELLLTLSKNIVAFSKALDICEQKFETEIKEGFWAKLKRRFQDWRNKKRFEKLQKEQKDTPLLPKAQNAATLSGQALLELTRKTANHLGFFNQAEKYQEAPQKNQEKFGQSKSNDSVRFEWHLHR
ncbi:MAG: GTPase domain-containing protein [Gammaproteobacteria bacterium]|nr:GTPase domain-containing protein [Gammaproteobacteria bacterium]